MGRIINSMELQNNFPSLKLQSDINLQQMYVGLWHAFCTLFEGYFYFCQVLSNMLRGHKYQHLIQSFYVVQPIYNFWYRNSSYNCDCYILIDSVACTYEIFTRHPSDPYHVLVPDQKWKVNKQITTIYNVFIISYRGIQMKWEACGFIRYSINNLGEIWFVGTGETCRYPYWHASVFCSNMSHVTF